MNNYTNQDLVDYLDTIRMPSPKTGRMIKIPTYHVGKYELEKFVNQYGDWDDFDKFVASRAGAKAAAKAKRQQARDKIREAIINLDKYFKSNGYDKCITNYYGANNGAMWEYLFDDDYKIQTKLMYNANDLHQDFWCRLDLVDNDGRAVKHRLIVDTKKIDSFSSAKEIADYVINQYEEFVKGGN